MLHSYYIVMIVMHYSHDFDDCLAFSTVQLSALIRFCTACFVSWLCVDIYIYIIIYIHNYIYIYIYQRLKDVQSVDPGLPKSGAAI